MNSIQRRRLQCKLLYQMNLNPEYAEQLGLVDKSYSRSDSLKHVGKADAIQAALSGRK